MQQAKEAPDFANGVAVDYLHAVGLLSFSYMFARIAKAAQAKTEAFYQNKVILAQYFAEKVLPGITARIAQIKAGSNLMMQLPEDYFTAQS